MPESFIPHAISQDHESRLDRRTYGLPTDRVRMRNLIRGVGHYCVFKKLRAFQLQLDETERKRVDALYDYWLDHDLKTQFNKEVLTEDTLGMFIDCEYPMIATARLSGMMLDYPKLLDKGIGGLRSDLLEKLKEQPDNNFYKAGIQCLDIFVDCASHLQQDAREQMASANMKRQKN